MAKQATDRFDPAFSNSFNQRFREKRFKFFFSLLQKIGLDKPVRILDIGGLEVYWESMGFIGQSNVHITLLNLEKKATKYDNFESIKGDATDLSMFKDNEFDIVYSNSVIEHLYTYQNQQKMANECRRVGKFYYVQTPNRYFPIEPHWLFPFFQFLPFRLKVYLTMNFNLGHYKKITNRTIATDIVKEVNLITQKNMETLFPDGQVYKEKFGRLTKSITMYRFPS